MTMSGMQIKISSKMTFFLTMPKQQNFFLLKLFKRCASFYTHYKLCYDHVRDANKKFKNDYFSKNAKTAKFLSFQVVHELC